MNLIIAGLIAIAFAPGMAVAQPSSRTLPNNPLNGRAQMARGTQPCPQDTPLCAWELKQQRQDIQRLIDRLDDGERLDPSELERALRDAIH
jgi:hypothetical protein